MIKIRHSLSGLRRHPSEPLIVIRDIWAGDADRAAEILGGSFRFYGRAYPFSVAGSDTDTGISTVQDEIAKFTWLRDLAALGTEEARLLARDALTTRISQPAMPDSPAQAAARLCAVISHFEFYGRTADDTFRKRLMRHLMLLARMLAATSPLPEGQWQSLTVVRGLLVAAFALPGFGFLRERALRLLDKSLQQIILSDGCVRQRSPKVQFEVVRELTEMSAILRMAQQPVSDVIMTTLARICPVLRAMRHGDGGLALFHGGWAHDGALVERVIQYAGRQKVVAPTMPDGGFSRLTGGKSFVLADAGAPPSGDYGRDAHRAPMSFEMSHGRQRLLVNCGAARLPLWDDVLRQSAAHNSLELEVFDIKGDAATSQAGQETLRVMSSTRLTPDGVALSMELHNPPSQTDLTWRRTLFLSADGQVFSGEEAVASFMQVAPIFRFHLAPQIRVDPAASGTHCTLLANDSVWVFSCEGANMKLEESVYFGRGFREDTHQIVLTGKVRPEDTSVERQGDESTGRISGARDTGPPSGVVSWKLMLQ